MRRAAGAWRLPDRGPRRRGDTCLSGAISHPRAGGDLGRTGLRLPARGPRRRGDASIARRLAPLPPGKPRRGRPVGAVLARSRIPPVPALRDPLRQDGTISKDDVAQVYIDEKLSTLISSDLYCDRLDYLKRTALHSGAPYGAVDVDFIISKSTVDGEGKFCFDRKAIRAADHLLVSRFYDFMQIPYHKTVASLEWSLEESVIHLLRKRTLRLSQPDMQKMLKDGQWANFDDGYVTELMRGELRKRRPPEDQIGLDHISAVLDRRPAKMVYNWECLVEYGNSEQDTKEKLLEYRIKEICSDLNLDRNRFTIWKAPFKLSKAGPILQGSPNDRDYSDEEEQQLIHILLKSQARSVPLIDQQNAVSHHLAKLRYKVLRVYYLPSKKDAPSIKADIRERMKDI